MPSQTSAPSARATVPLPKPPPKGGLNSLWRLRGYLRPYTWQLVVMAASALIGVGASLAIPLVTKQIIDGPIRHHDEGQLIALGVLAIVLGFVEAFMVFARRWIQANAVLGLETNLRGDIYAHLQRLPVAFHGQWHGGQLLSRITLDLSVIRRFLGFGALFLVINVLQVITVTVILLRMYWPLGLLVLASAIPIVVLSIRFERAYIKVSRQVQDEQGDVATIAEESAVGIRVIKAFGRRLHRYEVFDERARALYDTSMTKVRMSSRFWSALELIPNLTLALVLLIGALAVGSGSLTLGTIVAFTTYMLQLVWPIASLGHIMVMAQESMTAGDRIHEVLDSEPTIVDGTEEPTDIRGHLELQGVSFQFPDGDEMVLRDVWLDVQPGETVAIVGATGSGKTTLTALVPRLYDVTAGRILIDGHDIRDLTLPSLRSIVVTAFEEATLFSMSVRENLTLGRPDATEEDIRQALEVAQADFVDDLPWGLATRIGEQGMSLSGGQRQRLALARAVLADPRILVLDDTLSALDVETEALVEEALRHVLAEATGLVVAHRASTVLLADRVALIENDTISHVGTHHELLATVPAYRDLLGQDAEELGSEEVLS